MEGDNFYSERGLHMKVLIQKYDNTDEIQLKNLLNLFPDEEASLNIIKGPNCTFTYLAFVKNKLAGVAFGWTSRFHPSCTYFRILSHPFYEIYDIGDKLLTKVENTVDINLPLQTSILESAINLKATHERNGFKEIRRTYMPTLQLANVKGEFQLSDKDNHIIKTLADISLNDELMEKLTLLVRKNYTASHKVNPVVDAGLDTWKKLILANDTITKGSYVLLDRRQEAIIAYSFLHESDSKNIYELGWCGCSDKQDKELIPQLTLQHIRYAVNQGAESIVGEFDTTDDYAMEVLRTFPFAPCPTWITYQKAYN